MKKNFNSKTLKIHFAIALTGIALAGLVWMEDQRQLKGAWTNFLSAQHSVSKDKAADASAALRSIYENLRTISLLPSLRETTADKPISEDSRTTIQQMYNNLASNVDVSEVYLVQKNFDSSKIDPTTGEPFVPMMMFDELIVNAGKNANLENPFAETPANGHSTEPELPEVEEFEYRQLKEQLDYYSINFPTQAINKELNIPMTSGSSVITCDNRHFQHTGNDNDRKGLMFNVPFYTKSGNFNGLVSGIILERSLSALLPNQNYTLLSPTMDFQTNNTISSTAIKLDTINAQLPPQKTQKFFELLDLKTHDPRGTWKLRAEYDAATFYNSTEVNAIEQFKALALVLIGFLTFGGFAITHFANRRAKELKFNASHDALTGLPNSVMIREELAAALERSKKGEKFAVLYLDLDRFKLVNDTLGHTAGDTLLKGVAVRLKTCIGHGDMIARIGGDEFVLLCSLDGAVDILSVAQNIINTLAEPFNIDGQQATIGTSIGIALAPSDGSLPETLIRNADMALFRAKVEERNTYRFFEPEMDKQVQYRRKLEMDLRTALASEQFEVYYQAIVDTQSEKIVGFEALVRWNHPERGLIQPSEFIPIAEDIGIIIPLGEWILRKACMDAMSWPSSVRVAVNLSAVQFRNRTLQLIVVSALEQSGLPAKRLELEVTESVLITDDETARRALEQLQKIGVRIALDDFGTGYSSLSYLRSFKFDKIKIDRSFISEITSGKGNDLEIVKAVATLSHSLGMSTSAEGIETKEQLDMVRSQGCHEVQGYYYSRPVPIEQTNALFGKDERATAA